MRKLHSSAFVFVAAILFSLTGCKKEALEKPDPLIVSIITSNTSEVNTSSTISGGTISISGKGSIKSRGICWNTAPKPTIQHNKTSNGSGAGDFAATINGLQPAVTYFVKAYAIAENGDVFYGNEISFSTPSLLTIVTSTANGVSDVIATVGGTITIVGTEIINQRGICWNTIPDPLITNNKAEADAGGTNNFSSKLTGLSAQTKYYAKAYVVTASGNTVYGNQVDFTTAAVTPAPTPTPSPSPGNGNSITIITSAVSAISTTTATTGGSISIVGLETVSSRGVCWNTATNPTIANSKTVNGSGQGTFQSNLSSLTAGIKYYVRAYAINSSGIAIYGSQVEFTTPASTPAPTPTPAPKPIPTIYDVLFSSFKAIPKSTSATIQFLVQSDKWKITTFGICYGTSILPTIGDNKVVSNSTHDINTIITGLKPGTTYYVRAYAIVEGIVLYSLGSSRDAFRTLESDEFTVKTIAGTDFGPGYHNMGGEVSLINSQVKVTSRGISYHRVTDNGTVTEQKAVSGSGAGKFEIQIVDLWQNARYNFRAYATSSTGATVYGDYFETYIASTPKPPLPGPTPGPTPTPTPTPTPGTDGGDILLYSLVWGKATNNCKSGPGSDVIGYFTKVIYSKNLTAEKTAAEAQLRTKYGSAITDLYVSYSSYSIQNSRFAAIIQYSKKVSGWDCYSLITAFGFGKTKAEALDNVIQKKIDNAGNVSHKLLQELSW